MPGSGRRRAPVNLLLSLAGFAAWGATHAWCAEPVLEWRLEDGRVFTVASGGLGATGVTVEFRPGASPNGVRYDVRVRNRTGVDYVHTALRVRLPRTGSSWNALIEGLSVPLPAELLQRWERGPLDGAKYGFVYEIRSGPTTVAKVGPSNTEGQWGGRAAGVVRVDGKAYVVPEFWERQPRRIEVNSGEVVLTLFEGAEPLRAGEDVWDRFAVLDGEGLSDAALLAEAEALPNLSAAARQALLQRFTMAPEGLTGVDPEAEALLRKYDRWQGASWEKRYGDENPARSWTGEADAERTTLFSLLAKGWYYPEPDPMTYTWRDYGDIQWGDGKCSLHYDWVRAAFRHYLRTGNQEALRWGMAAMRHAVAVDHLWENPAYPATYDYTNLAGLARYEKGDHGGGDFVARATHTWVEGLLLAYAITQDPWVREAAVDTAAADWRVWGGDRAAAAWDGAYGETRVIGWPLLALVAASRETGDERFWRKAGELMRQLLEQEQRSGGKGYVTTNPVLGVGYVNNAHPLMSFYTVMGMTSFADEAIRRGEWNEDYAGLVKRWATWLTSPVPNGAYFPTGAHFTPPDPAVAWGSFAYVVCPPGLDCFEPTSTQGRAEFNIMASDVCSWLAEHDPSGRNPDTGRRWEDLARLLFRDSLEHGPHPSGIVGFLTDQFPTSETKVMGWMQLFQDRTARRLAGLRGPPDVAGTPDLAVDKTHVGNFGVETRGTYTLTVRNVGSAATSGTIALTDELPPELAYVSAVGVGWTCSAAGQTVTCTRTSPIGAGASSVVILTVAVLASASGTVTNQAEVAVAGEVNVSNNSAVDPTFVLRSAPQIADLTATPPVFSPNADGVNDSVAFHFRLSAADHLTAGIYDARGVQVATLLDGAPCEEGGRTLVWDGRTDGGETALDGNYTWRIWGRQAPAVDRSVGVNTTVPEAARSWYLAEGSTVGFEAFVMIQNPNPTPTHVTVTFFKQDGAIQTHQETVYARTRATVPIHGHVPNIYSVSTGVEADQPIIVERAMYFFKNGRAGHDSIGATAASPTWFFPANRTYPGDEDFILITNPSSQPCTVTVTYYLDDAAPAVQIHPVAAASRYTLPVHGYFQGRKVSAALRSTAPIAAERAFYFGGRTGGSAGIGAVSPSYSWYFAEGDTFHAAALEIMNPGAQPALVQVNYLLEDGGQMTQAYPLAGERRLSVDVNRDVGADQRFSIEVLSDAPIVAERVMYSAHDCGDSIGAPTAALNWRLAEGFTAYGYQTWVVVSNPGAEAANVTATLMLQDGDNLVENHALGPKRRLTLYLNDLISAAWPGTIGASVSTEISADRPVVVERTMKFDNGRGMHQALGVRW